MSNNSEKIVPNDSILSYIYATIDSQRLIKEFERLKENKEIVSFTLVSKMQGKMYVEVWATMENQSKLREKIWILSSEKSTGYLS